MKRSGADPARFRLRVPLRRSGASHQDRYSGDVVSTVGYTTKRQVDAAVAAAKRAQIAWARTTVAERAGVLTAAVDAIAERSEEISRWITTEMGKTIAESREEVIDVTLTIARLDRGRPAVRWHQSAGMEREPQEPTHPHDLPADRGRRIHLAVELSSRDGGQLRRCAHDGQRLRMEAE